MTIAIIKFSPSYFCEGGTVVVEGNSVHTTDEEQFQEQGSNFQIVIHF